MAGQLTFGEGFLTSHPQLGSDAEGHNQQERWSKYVKYSVGFRYTFWKGRWARATTAIHHSVVRIIILERWSHGKP